MILRIFSKLNYSMILSQYNLIKGQIFSQLSKTMWYFRAPVNLTDYMNKHHQEGVTESKPGPWTDSFPQDLCATFAYPVTQEATSYC